MRDRVRELRSECEVAGVSSMGLASDLADKLVALTLRQLRDVCKEAGLGNCGDKAALQVRLANFEATGSTGETAQSAMKRKAAKAMHDGRKAELSKQEAKRLRKEDRRQERLLRKEDASKEEIHDAMPPRGEWSRSSVDWKHVKLGLCLAAWPQRVAICLAQGCRCVPFNAHGANRNGDSGCCGTSMEH